MPSYHTPGNLSVGNAQSFLENGIYLDKSQDFQNVTVTKNICGREITFDVYDSVTGFTESRWKRIVACFVHGHES